MSVGSRQERCDLLDHFFSSQRPMFSLSAGVWNPPTDVSETIDRIHIQMEIGGVCKNDLSVTLDRGILTIRGRRYDRPPAEQETYHLMELRYGCFERAFRLPADIDPDGIEAAYREGILSIEIPKGKGNQGQVQISVFDDK
jgi:HSP20 family protein